MAKAQEIPMVRLRNPSTGAVVNVAESKVERMPGGWEPYEYGDDVDEPTGDDDRPAKKPTGAKKTTAKKAAAPKADKPAAEPATSDTPTADAAGDGAS